MGRNGTGRGTHLPAEGYVTPAELAKISDRTSQDIRRDFHRGLIGGQKTTNGRIVFTQDEATVITGLHITVLQQRLDLIRGDVGQGNARHIRNYDKALYDRKRLRDSATMYVSASKLSTYMDCPRKYYFSEVQELEPIDISTKLDVGRGFHELVGLKYEVDQAKITWDMDKAMVAWQRVNSDIEDEVVTQVRKVTDDYLEYIKDFEQEYTLVGSEYAFELPLPGLSNYIGRQVILTGTMDGLALDKQNRLWIVERKTAADFPSEDILQIDVQNGTYILAGTMLFQNPLAGMVYQVIRKLKTKPRSKEIGQVYYIRKNTEAREQYMLFLETIIQRIYRDTVNGWLVKQPCPSRDCTWKCAYKPLCWAMSNGYDWTSVAGFKIKEPRLPWSDKIKVLLFEYCKEDVDRKVVWE